MATMTSLHLIAIILLGAGTHKGANGIECGNEDFARKICTNAEGFCYTSTEFNTELTRGSSKSFCEVDASVPYPNEFKKACKAAGEKGQVYYVNSEKEVACCKKTKCLGITESWVPNNSTFKCNFGRTIAGVVNEVLFTRAGRTCLSEPNFCVAVLKKIKNKDVVVTSCPYTDFLGDDPLVLAQMKEFYEYCKTQESVVFKAGKDSIKCCKKPKCEKPSAAELLDPWKPKKTKDCTTFSDNIKKCPGYNDVCYVTEGPSKDQHCPFPGTVESWEKFMEACEKLTDNNKQRHYIHGSDTILCCKEKTCSNLRTAGANSELFVPEIPDTAAGHTYTASVPVKVSPLYNDTSGNGTTKNESTDAASANEGDPGSAKPQILLFLLLFFSFYFSLFLFLLPLIFWFSSDTLEN